MSTETKTTLPDRLTVKAACVLSVCTDWATVDVILGYLSTHFGPDMKPEPVRAVLRQACDRDWLEVRQVEAERTNNGTYAKEYRLTPAGVKVWEEARCAVG